MYTRVTRCVYEKIAENVTQPIFVKLTDCITTHRKKKHKKLGSLCNFLKNCPFGVGENSPNLVTLTYTYLGMRHSDNADLLKQVLQWSEPVLIYFPITAFLPCIDRMLQWWISSIYNTYISVNLVYNSSPL
jgi:hypothetical protein